MTDDKLEYVRLQDGTLDAEMVPVLQSICPSCGATERGDLGCVNEWHTRQREREIAEVSNAIALLNGVILMASPADKVILQTTLRREIAALAELRCGWREK